MLKTEKYIDACSAISRQRERMLERSRGVSVFCLACGKRFVITDESEDLLYCREAHRVYHRAAARESEVSFMDFEDAGKG